MTRWGVAGAFVVLAVLAASCTSAPSAAPPTSVSTDVVATTRPPQPATTVPRPATTVPRPADVITLPAPVGSAGSALLPLPLPDPVPVKESPTMAVADPAFVALPGAEAHFGMLGGTSFQIEMPEQWNGTLVMWMHGFDGLQPEAKVGPPDFRRHLIAGGVAWAASSFSNTSMIPGLAADETAALWDHFVARFGRPRWTYVSGFSMGGWATHIAAERYANRYDGALALCGAAGTETGLSVSVEQVVAAAYVVGLSQSDVDATADLVALLNERVRPALDDPATRQRVIDLVVAMTGGPRRFAGEGLIQELTTNWERATLLIAARLVPPRTRPYELVGAADDAVADFNARAVVFPTDAAAYARFSAGTDLTGRLGMPLLTLHTTGDGQVPIGQAQHLRRLVTTAGREANLVQRVVEDPGHCGFTTAEQEAALDDLRGWVERGVRPAGTDLSRPDLDHLDRTFELQPRQRAADTTVRVIGDATLDGRPFGADFVGAVVIDDGLVTPCQASIPVIVNGHVDLSVLTVEAGAGCVRPGVEIVLWTYAGDTRLFSNRIAVPTTGDVEPPTITFSSGAPRASVPPTNDVQGEAYAADGGRIERGRIEARIGGELCGVASIRDHGSFNGYVLSILADDDGGRCPRGADVELTVDGLPGSPVISNTERGRYSLDLTVSP